VRGDAYAGPVAPRTGGRPSRVARERTGAGSSGTNWGGSAERTGAIARNELGR
jgi:hypothetical protein